MKKSEKLVHLQRVQRSQVWMGKVCRITDPCYNKDTWCAGTAQVVPGAYNVDADVINYGNWGRRVARLFIYRAEDWHNVPVGQMTEQLPIDVGVDSGQCGFFDEAAYPKGDTGSYPGDDGSFYGKACDITLNAAQWGVMPDSIGVVSSSGIGDGSYICWGHKSGERNGKPVYDALMLEFISE